MFRFNENAESLLEPIAREEWALDEMKAWSEKDVTELLDIAQSALLDSVESMRLKADVIRKDRAVGLFDSLPLSFLPPLFFFFSTVFLPKQNVRHFQTRHVFSLLNLRPSIEKERAI